MSTTMNSNMGEAESVHSKNMRSFKQQQRQQRLNRFQNGIAKVGTAIQKINLPRRIGEMEQDQELADHLEARNRDLREEADRQELVREATAACLAEIEEHLVAFLCRTCLAQSSRHPTYEEWIQELHPENVNSGMLFQEFQEVDLRFYVADSDHRRLWNARAPPDRQIAARTMRCDSSGKMETIDLLAL